MARKALIQRENKAYLVQEYSRCLACGRSHSVYRKFKLCQICLRQQVYQGVILGLKKLLGSGKKGRKKYGN